jgi:hypothetical protein
MIWNETIPVFRAYEPEELRCASRTPHGGLRERAGREDLAAAKSPPGPITAVLPAADRELPPDPSSPRAARDPKPCAAPLISDALAFPATGDTVTAPLLVQASSSVSPFNSERS